MFGLIGAQSHSAEAYERHSHEMRARTYFPDVFLVCLGSFCRIMPQFQALSLAWEAARAQV